MLPSTQSSTEKILKSMAPIPAKSSNFSLGQAKRIPPVTTKSPEKYDINAGERRNLRASQATGNESGRSTNLVQRPSCFTFSGGREDIISFKLYILRSISKRDKKVR